MYNSSHKISLEQIRNLLTIRYNPDDPTLFPKFDPSQFNPINLDENGKITESILIKNLKSKLEPIDSISISLSSGIDSSLVLALVRKIFPMKKINAYCGIFNDGFDESNNAEKIAEKFDADFKIVKMDSVFTFMPKLISITKNPKWNTYSHLIAKEAKKNNSQILLTGDGADELFGGYTFRYSKFLKNYDSNHDWLKRTKNYLSCHNRDWVEDQEKIFGKQIKFSWDKIFKYFKSTFKTNFSGLDQIFISDYNGKLLHDFLPTSYSISKYYHIPIYSPFVSNSITHFAMNLSSFQKYDLKSDTGKIILRKISNRMNVKHINEKKGFSPSLFYDWNEYGKTICSDFLTNRDSLIFDYKLINPEWITRAFEKINNDGDVRYLTRVISILALEIWMRIFITKEFSSNKKL